MNDEQRSEFRVRIERVSRESTAHVKAPSIDWASNRILEALGENPTNISDAAIADTLKKLAPTFPTHFASGVTETSKPRETAEMRLERANANPKPATPGAKPARKASSPEEAKAVAALPTHLRLAWANDDFDAPGFARTTGISQ
jgi:hypothetical protein